MASTVSRQLTLGQDAVVCKDAELTGEITLGSKCIVHPGAKIIAEGGPIVMGEGNLIKEAATIINKKRSDGQQHVLIVGNGNVFDVNSYCAAVLVGNGNTFEPRSHVEPSVAVTENCVIGASCRLSGREELPSGTVICGSTHTRYNRANSKSIQAQPTQQLTMLTKLLPNYHKLVKT